MIEGARRLIRATKSLARDSRVPKLLRGLAAFGLLTIPGLVDEIALLIVGLLMCRVREAWRGAALPDLVRALSKRAHFVVGAVRTDVVTVGVLGSFADGGQADLKRFLCAWQVEHPGIETDIEIDNLRAVTVLPIPLPRANINDASFVHS